MYGVLDKGVGDKGGRTAQSWGSVTRAVSGVTDA